MEDQENHARLQELFLAASELTADERAAFLDRACPGKLRAALERLLAAHETETSLAGLAPTAAGPEALVGTILDGLYEIEALLGRGGMGTVYRARHVLLNDTVAIKLLQPDAGTYPAWLQRFVREGQAARRFRHPNAVAVYDLRATEGGTAYLVLEYVAGQTLRSEMRGRSRLGAAAAAGIVEGVASALDAAHRAGVVHRDVKPENIMLTTGSNGERVVKLLDLGVAKLLETREAPDESGVGLTRAGAMVGTPRYMSPEQWGAWQRDGKADVDGRADVYSLGVVTYEMVCGTLPFHADTWQELRHKHEGEEAQPAHERMSGLTEAFGRAIARAMAKDRADRFATAGAFARALGEALASEVDADAETRILSSDTGAGAVGDRTEVGASATGEVAWTTGGRDARTEANPPTNLPEQLTSFVGREREVEDLVRLLGEERMVTVVGPGGMGKTRLALQATRQALERFPDGAWFADLAPLSDPALVATSVASALGVRESPGLPLLDALCGYSQTKRLLVVLDNCEHLAATCSELATRLLRSCPHVRVLATSREVLGIAGEVVWQATPLEAREAELLFAERARSVRRDFSATERNASSIGELCLRLEGIPLAVELAAARAGVLTPAQILTRIGQRLNLLVTRQSDVPTRHQTLRASIEWSYELMKEEERRAFATLSVFRGGWTLDAADGVVGRQSAATPADVVDLLERLRECSMIVAEEHGEEMRYGMLETLREYGLERLAEREEVDESRRRHADYFLALAESARLRKYDAREAKWLVKLEEEHDNLRAALRWLLEHDADGCLRLAVAVHPLWWVHGHLMEGRRWLAAALERSPSSSALTRCTALNAAGNMARTQGDLPAARTYFGGGARIAREIADTWRIVASSFGLGSVAEMQGDLQAARTHYEESLAGARQMQDDRMIANTLNGLGEVARQQGDWTSARELYEQAIVPARRSGSNEALIAVLSNLGTIACEDGDLRAARTYYSDALELAQTIGGKNFLAFTMDGLGTVAARQGAWTRAGRLAGAAEALRDAIGSHVEPADQAFCARYVAEVRQAVGAEGLAAALAEGRSMTLDQAIAYALADE
jgi:predicted ATPase/serine/threonine protein kinase/Tfp pilus assembly protein PilF